MLGPMDQHQLVIMMSPQELIDHKLPIRNVPTSSETPLPRLLGTEPRKVLSLMPWLLVDSTDRIILVVCSIDNF